MKYVPDSGQIVLTLETRVTRTLRTEPNMQKRLIMAVWRIRSLHLSRTEARYLVGSMSYGVVWEQVYGMLRKLASPESRVFSAYTGEDTAIYGAACQLPNHIGQFYQCQPPPLSNIMHLGDRPVHWLCIAVHGTSRHEPRMFIARWVGPLAPTNYLGGGYKGEVKNMRHSKRPPKRFILMMSCARPQS